MMSASPGRRILLLGGSGRLGRVLSAAWRDHHVLLQPDRQAADLSRPETLEARLNELSFDTLVNCAGLTSPDACETDPELARRVNALAPAALAKFCAQRPARFIHLSTDYVFGGEGSEPLAEDAPAHPVNVYGRSKLDGERAVLDACPDSLVARVSWLFGPAGGDVPDAVLARAQSGSPLDFIEDKWSVPTWTPDLADWLERLIGEHRDVTGILHLCHGGRASWRDFAQAVLDLGHEVGLLPVALQTTGRRLEDFTAFRAMRPPWTVMDNARLATLMGAPPRSWREALALHLQRLGGRT